MGLRFLNYRRRFVDLQTFVLLLIVVPSIMVSLLYIDTNPKALPLDIDTKYNTIDMSSRYPIVISSSCMLIVNYSLPTVSC